MAAPTNIARIMRELERALSDIEQNPRRPEAELRRRAETVRRQLSGLTAAVLIANNRGRYIDVNRAATILTGYTRSELLRLSVADLTPTANRATARRLWEQFIERDRMSGAYPIRRRDGRIVRCRYMAVANILPGVHVSVLLTPALARALRTKPARRKKAS